MVERVVLGRVAGHHGLRGWLKVLSFTDPREGLFAYESLHLGDSAAVEFESQVRGKLLLLRPAGASSREDAEVWRDAEIWLPKSDMPEPEPGEYYWHDLEGCSVDTVDGQPLGLVDRMMATGANDVMVVRGTQETLIPFVQGVYVMSVDVKTKRITVDWDPEAL
ncbi:MAG: ribosome maturation factor RimM [Pseudomonadota bacterium]